MNGWHKLLFFGKRGELRERGLPKLLKEKKNLREDLLKHISPLEWEPINFLGEYTFDMAKIRSLNSLRPLNQ